MADQSRPVTGYPATAPYAYNANPVPNSTAYYYPPPPPPIDPRANLLRRLTAAVLLAFIIVLTIFFISWIIIRPRVPEVTADAVTVTNFNVNNSLLTGNWMMNFTVRNPNKKSSLSYDYVEAEVCYGSEYLAGTKMPPFTQGKQSESVVGVKVAAADGYVGKAAEKIAKERREKGSVVFNARLEARVLYKVGGWRARSRSLRIFCGNLQVALPVGNSTGLMSGGPRRCRVGF